MNSMAATTPRASVVEAGHPGGMTQTWHPSTGFGYAAAPDEETPDLAFPENLRIFNRMRREDGQIGSLLRAMTLPLTKANWTLNGDGVDPAILEFVRVELGLTEPGKPQRRRRRQGIVWRDHLREALLALPFGFVPFEQVYEVGPPTKEQADAGVTLDQVAHLRKLGLRHPTTVREITVARDGGLLGIWQRGRGVDSIVHTTHGYTARAGASLDDLWISSDRLVMYSLEREGADWTGNSVLRQSYKHWLLKDILLRVGAQSVERNGMGIPVVTYDDEAGGSQTEALDIATNMRAGATAGVAIPANKYSVELLGLKGSIKDELPLVKYHDEACSRSTLQMFLNLGHDNGARNLGETFVDWYIDSLQAVAEWISDVATEHIIRDLVELNFGVDATYPALECEDLSSSGSATDEGLKALADAGLLTPDDDLEDHVRRTRRLPAKATHSGPEPEQDAADANQDTPEHQAPFQVVAASEDPLTAQAAALVGRLRDLTEVT